MSAKRAALLLAVAHAVCGCAVVHNYDDPDGPRYAERYSTTRDRSAEPLTVVTFNIKFSNEIERAIQELERNPELAEAGALLLQEMDSAGTDAIASHFGYDYVYYPGSEHQGKEFGNAVLSRWPIIADQKLILPYRNPANGRIRIAVAVDIETPEGLVGLVSVHNETPWLGPRARLEQAQFIAASAGAVPHPTVVAGDFNTLEGRSIDETVELFGERGFVWASRSVDASTDSPLGSFTLDHVFVRGFQVQSARTQATEASDHQPIWVTLHRSEPP